MPDIQKIKRNIGKMIDQGAPESDIDEYIKSEGVTIDQLKQPVESQKQVIQQAQTKPIGSLWSAIAEPIANVGTGLIGKAVGDIAGLGAIPLHAAGMISSDPTDIQSSVRNALTYQPKTQVGSSAYNPINAVNNAIGAVLGGAGEWAGNKIAGTRDNRDNLSFRGMLGNAVEEAIPQAAGVGMMKYPGVISKPINLASKLVTVPAKWAYNIAEPYIPVVGGSKPIIGRTLLEAAKSDAPAIAKALQQYSPEQEPVPGYKSTAGEVASGIGSPTFSALQAQAPDIVPKEYMARGDANSVARLNYVNQIANDPAFANPVMSPLEAAKTLRDANAAANYGPIMDKLIPQNPEIEALLKRPSIKNALQKALQSAAEREGYAPVSPNDPLSVGNLQRMKMAMDDITSNPKDFGLGAAEVGDIRNTRTALVNFIENRVPAWGEARKQYATESIPINNMQTGQYLTDLLKGSYVPGGDLPLNTKGFLDAIRKTTDVSDTNAAQRASDLVINRATNTPRYTELNQYMSPENMDAIYNLRDNLIRSDIMKSQAKKGMQSAPDISQAASQSMEKAIGGKLINPLNRTIMVMNQIIARSEGKVNAEMAAQIAKDMLDPNVIGSQMEQALRRKAKIQSWQNALNAGRNINALGVMAAPQSNVKGMLTEGQQ